MCGIHVIKNKNTKKEENEKTALWLYLLDCHLLRRYFFSNKATILVQRTEYSMSNAGTSRILVFHASLSSFSSFVPSVNAAELRASCSTIYQDGISLQSTNVAFLAASVGGRPSNIKRLWLKGRKKNLSWQPLHCISTALHFHCTALSTALLNSQRSSVHTNGAANNSTMASTHAVCFSVVWLHQMCFVKVPEFTKNHSFR